MSDAPRLPLIVLAGATGTGKSDLALRISLEIGGVVINADSRQVYADFPIITAQPPARDMALVPHALYGFLSCAEKITAAAWSGRAATAVREALDRGLAPILVGGTGLYLRALLQGIAPIPPVAPDISRRWQAECSDRGSPVLHGLLAQRDPSTAARLHPNDSQRIVRALEVLEGTGKPLSYWHARPLPSSPYRPLSWWVDVPLDALVPLLAERVDAMLAAGAVDEARAALDRCPDHGAPGWSGIGCAELRAHLENKMDITACRAAWIQNTRSYAKRQITWFKKEEGMERVDPVRDREKVLGACRRFWEKELARR